MNPLIDKEVQERFIVNDISKQIRDDQYDILQMLVQDSIHPNMQAVEIGSWTGLSAVLIGQIVQRMRGQLHSFDWYKGSNDGAFHLKETAKLLDVPQVFRNNIEFFGLSDTVFLTTISSEEASNLFSMNSLDFIFIDGDHTYQGVKRDIEIWYPKLKPGKIICGHDYRDNKSEVWKAVDESFPRVLFFRDIWWYKKTENM